MTTYRVESREAELDGQTFEWQRTKFKGLKSYQAAVKKATKLSETYPIHEFRVVDDAGEYTIART